MDRAEVISKLKTVISDELGVAVDAILESSKFSELGADSLDILEIIMAIEDKFQIEASDEEASKVTTLREACDLILKKISSRKA
ncbi:MAG TPA: acyl carrier protein [Pseudomonas sp.]